MGFTRESATERARQDLAKRLDVDVADVDVLSVTDQEFPDMSLGAGEDGEMSGQMISSGWEIKLTSNGDTYEYRADKYQLRLVDFGGRNYIIE